MTAIKCPECGHGIDEHSDMTAHVGRRCRVEAEWGGPLCGCDLRPSDIARALLTAEPTEAEVEAMADYLSPRPFLFVMHGQTPEEAASARLDHARAALRAAREARA